MKRFIFFVCSCALIACGQLKLKEPVYRKSQDSLFAELAGLAPFQKIAIKTTSKQDNGSLAFHEIDVTLNYGHADSLSNEALQTLAESVDTLVNRGIANIQDYNFVNVIFVGEVDKFETGQTQKNVYAFIPTRSK